MKVKANNVWNNSGKGYMGFGYGLPFFLGILILVSAVGVGAESKPTGTDELPSAETILDKYVTATGGVEAYDNIKNRVMKATMLVKPTNIKMVLTTYHTKPNKLYEIIDCAVTGRETSGSDGNVVWENTPVGGPQIIEGEQRIFALREGLFDRMSHWRNVITKAECNGIENIDGKPCYKVTCYYAQGYPEILYFDKKSGLMVRMDLTLVDVMGKFRGEVYFSDYRKTDGILFSFKILGRTEDQDTMEIQVDEVSHNVDIPKSYFELPQEIRDLLNKTKKTNSK